MPTTEEVRTDLAEIVNEVAGVPTDDVQLDKSFTDDLDVDSLSMVEIIYAAEEKFGVSIPDEEAKNLKTVGDAVAYIERAAACPTAAGRGGRCADHARPPPPLPRQQHRTVNAASAPQENSMSQIRVV